MSTDQTSRPTLFMAMLGCRPEGRITEQHDMFFGIAHDIVELVPAIKASWPEAKGNIHLDAWRKVMFIDGFSIEVIDKNPDTDNASMNKLFFINLGGYRPNEFDEFHYKMLVVAPDKAKAVSKAKTSDFYKTNGFKGAASHIDEKYGLDVDDIYEIEDLLPAATKLQYQLKIVAAEESAPDEINLGYMQLHRLKEPSE